MHTIATTDSGFPWGKYQKSITDFLKSFFSPLTVSILVSFPIALIPKLKALFVYVPGTHMPSAPDGQPPLAFLMDTVSFIGGSAIPMGLICLGSSLARLNIPKRGEWRKLPLGAIGTLAAGKLLITPVIGVLMCQGLTKVGFIPRDDKNLRFVCMQVFATVVT
jgi:predicted permease